MTKKESIWRELLVQFHEHKKQRFTQKELAAQFNVSLSTVFNALKAPRASGAVTVSGRDLVVKDFEKLLMLWASERSLNKEIIYATHSDLPVLKREGMMPPDVIFAAYSAYRLRHRDAPADYDKVSVYADDAASIEKRFPPAKGYPNLFVLKADPYLRRYGNITPDVQTFADIWNLSDWYAKDYLAALRRRLPL